MIGLAGYLVYLKISCGWLDLFGETADRERKDGSGDCEDSLEPLFVAIGNIIAWLLTTLHMSRRPSATVCTTRTFGIIAWKYFQVLRFYAPILLGFAVCFSVLFKTHIQNPDYDRNRFVEESNEENYNFLFARHDASFRNRFIPNRKK